MRSTSVTDTREAESKAATPTHDQSPASFNPMVFNIDPESINDESIAALRSLATSNTPSSLGVTTKSESSAASAATSAPSVKVNNTTLTTESFIQAIPTHLVDKALASVQTLYPNIHQDQKTKLAFALIHLSEGQTRVISKDQCERILSYINAERMSPAKADHINLEITRLLRHAHELSPPQLALRLKEVLVILDDAIQQYKSASWLYLTRAGYALYEGNRTHELVEQDISIAAELQKTKIDREPKYNELFCMASRDYAMSIGNFDLGRQYQAKLLEYTPPHLHEAVNQKFIERVTYMASSIMPHNKRLALDYYNFLNESIGETSPAIVAMIDFLSTVCDVPNPSLANRELRIAETYSFKFNSVNMQKEMAFIQSKMSSGASVAKHPKIVAAQLKKEKANQLKLLKEQKLKASELALKKEQDAQRAIEAAQNQAAKEAKIQLALAKQKSDAEKKQADIALATAKAEKEEKDIVERALRKDVRKTMKDLLDRLDKNEKRAQKALRKASQAQIHPEQTHATANIDISREAFAADPSVQSTPALAESVSEVVNVEVQKETEMAIAPLQPSCEPIIIEKAKDETALSAGEAVNCDIANEPAVIAESGSDIQQIEKCDRSNETTEYPAGATADAASVETKASEQSPVPATASTNASMEAHTELQPTPPPPIQQTSSTSLLLTQLNEKSLQCQIQEQVIAHLRLQQAIMQHNAQQQSLPMPYPQAQLMGYPAAEAYSIPPQTPAFAMPNPYVHAPVAFANQGMGYFPPEPYGFNPMTPFAMQSGYPMPQAEGGFYPQQGYVNYPLMPPMVLAPPAQAANSYANAFEPSHASANHRNRFMSTNQGHQSANNQGMQPNANPRFRQ
jgi:hypothetical protein